MSLSITDVFTPATVAQWETKLLTFASTLGLKTTSWQPGGVVRTIFAIWARGFAAGDQIVSVQAQGGFLEFAAAVTPDPSLDVSITTPGWLDILADGGYNVQRDPATFATGTETIVNSTSNTFGPFAPGTFHIDRPGGPGYHNVNSLTIPPGTTTGLFAADLRGVGGTSAPGTITHLSSPALTGVAVNNVASFVGANAQSNDEVVALCRAKQAARSPDGPSDAYRFFAIESALLLAALIPSVTIVPITRVLVEQDKSTGVVTTTVANANGAVTGVALLRVIAATNATPVEIQTDVSHGLNTGDWATVQGVQGNGGANITSTIIVTAADKFTLDGSVGTGAYLSGGVVEGGDLGQVDRIIQANVVPDGVTAITQTATAVGLVFVVDVWVTSLYSSSVTTPIEDALTLYISRTPIGGYTDPVGSYTNVVPIDAVIGEVYAACILAEGAPSVAKNVTATINGVSANLTLAPHEVATITSIAVAVHSV